jgi:hypothetical protein
MVRACSCLSLVVAAANIRQHPTLFSSVAGRTGYAVMLGLIHSAASALVLTRRKSHCIRVRFSPYDNQTKRMSALIQLLITWLKITFIHKAKCLVSMFTPPNKTNFLRKVLYSFRLKPFSTLLSEKLQANFKFTY